MHCSNVHINIYTLYFVCNKYLATYNLRYCNKDTKQVNITYTVEIMELIYVCMYVSMYIYERVTNLVIIIYTYMYMNVAMYICT